MDRALNWILQYQLFLFDFDGLLVDTEPLHFLAYQQMCKERGYELPWDLETFYEVAHGSATGLRTRIYAEFPSLQAEEPRWEVLYQEKKDAYEHLLQEGIGVRLMPGVQELLTALDEAAICRCVVTNSFRAQTDRICQHLPILKTIPHWITRECYERPKPAPDGYLTALARYAKPNDRVIGFEDSLKGFQSLQAAGVEGVLVCKGGHVESLVDMQRS